MCVKAHSHLLPFHSPLTYIMFKNEYCDFSSIDVTQIQHDGTCSSYVSCGLVVFCPDDHNTVLSEYNDNSSHCEEIKTQVPHVIMVHQFCRFELEIPGGSIEDGETPLECVNREWKEEVMGTSTYDRNIFSRDDFRFMKKNWSGSRIVYQFIRIIRDRSTYIELMKDFHKFSVERMIPGSIVSSMDTFEPLSMPIWMEAGNTHVSFPTCLESMSFGHRGTFLLCVLYKFPELGYQNILGEEGKRLFLKNISYDMEEYLNQALKNWYK